MADNMTLEEALDAASTATETTDICLIDPVTRKIDIPDTRKVLGVESDEEAERLYFKCLKIVGDEIDLSELLLRVNFQNADGELDQYVVEDKAVDGEYVTFSWQLSRKVTRYKGTVGFVICAVSVGTDGIVKNEWNTALNTDCYVLEGLEVTSDVVEESDPEVIEWIVAHFEEVIEAGSMADEASENASSSAVSAAEAAASAQKAVSDMEEVVQSAEEIQSAVKTVQSAAKDIVNLYTQLRELAEALVNGELTVMLLDSDGYALCDSDGSALLTTIYYQEAGCGCTSCRKGSSGSSDSSGGTSVSEDSVASDEEVDEMLDSVFGTSETE